MFYFFPKDKYPLRVDFQPSFSNVNFIILTCDVKSEIHIKFCKIFLIQY
jgi:hypothetical protein